MKKLIIFDLDGTLLDTIDDLAQSVNHALSLHNFPTHPTEAFNLFIGNGLNTLLERALPEANRNSDTISQLKTDFVAHYYKHAEELTKPYPGITDLLKTLSESGYQLGIASNKIHPPTVALASRFFENIHFVSVLGQREGHPVKPNPSILNEIIEKAKVSHSEVLFVGDSGVDAATAFNAKVDFVGVLWGFRPRRELEDVGATRFASNSKELLEIILSF